MICPTCQVPCTIPVTLGTPGHEQQTWMKCPSCDTFPDSIRHCRTAGLCLNCGGRGSVPIGRWTESGEFVTHNAPCSCRGERYDAAPDESDFTPRERQEAQQSILRGIIGR